MVTGSSSREGVLQTGARRTSTGEVKGNIIEYIKCFRGRGQGFQEKDSSSVIMRGSNWKNCSLNL